MLSQVYVDTTKGKDINVFKCAKIIITVHDFNNALEICSLYL